MYGDSVTREFPADDVEDASAGNARAKSSVPTSLKSRKIVKMSDKTISANALHRSDDLII